MPSLGHHVCVALLICIVVVASCFAFSEAAKVPATGYVKISPDLHLAVCYIHKAASTTVSRFLLYAQSSNLSRTNDVLALRREKVLVSLWQQPNSVKNALRNDLSWQWVLIYRDPVERFASAFLDKCVRWGATSSQCPLRLPASRKDRANASRILDVLETTPLAAVDSHFLPASLRCPHWSLQNYTVIPYEALLSGFTQVVARLTRIPRTRHQELKLGVNAIIGDRASEIAVAGNMSSAGAAAVLAKQWASAKPGTENATIFARARRYYAADYLRFEGLRV